MSEKVFELQEQAHLDPADRAVSDLQTPLETHFIQRRSSSSMLTAGTHLCPDLFLHTTERITSKGGWQGVSTKTSKKNLLRYYCKSFVKVVDIDMAKDRFR